MSENSFEIDEISYHDAVINGKNERVIVQKQEILPHIIDFREPLLKRLKTLDRTPVDNYSVDWHENDGAKGLSKSVVKMLLILKEKLLRRKWGDVVQIVNSLALSQQKSGDIPEIVWRVGNEVIYNHPNSKGNIMMLIDHMNVASKLHTSINPLKITLEHAFLLFVLKDFQEAGEILKTFQAPLATRRSSVDNRTGAKHSKPLFMSYIGLGSYLQWRVYNLKGQCDTNLNGDSQPSLLAKEAIQCFDQMMKSTVGVWDSLIEKYTLLLKHYNKYKKAKSVLTTYVSRNPNNPNAFVYLYNFLNEDTPHNFDNDKEKLECLLKLKDLDPTHFLMKDIFQYAELLSNNTTILIAFDLVEHSKWSYDENIWTNFARPLAKMYFEKNENELNEIIKDYAGCEKLKDRISWWPEYFFSGNEFLYCKEQSNSLVVSRYIVAMVLGHDLSEFCLLAESDTDIDLSKLCEHLTGLKDLFS